MYCYIIYTYFLYVCMIISNSEIIEMKKICKIMFLQMNCFQEVVIKLNLVSVHIVLL